MLEAVPPLALAGAATQATKTKTLAPALTGVSVCGFFVRQGVRDHQRRKKSTKKKDEILKKGDAMWVVGHAC